MDNSNKIILDLCGGTGSWSKPYKDARYDVRIITLPDNDVFNFLNNLDYFLEEVSRSGKIIYGIFAAPVCTQFSFARTNAKTPRDLREGMKLVIACQSIVWKCMHWSYDKGCISDLKFWVFENPKGYLRKFLGLPVFNFDTYEFDENYSKNTDLWGMFNLPGKKQINKSQIKLDFKRRNKVKVPSISDLVNGKDRSAIRSITPPGFARAFFKANQ